MEMRARTCAVAAPVTLVAMLLAPCTAFAASVDFQITQPRTHQIRSTDPNVYVEGIAKGRGQVGKFDIIIVIDASQSASEPTGSDVNEDGIIDEDHAGEDSIYKAEIHATLLFQHMLTEIPLNEIDPQGNRRVRLGLVTYAGKGGLQDHRARKIFLSDMRSAQQFDAMRDRDASIESGLTADYELFKSRLAAASLKQEKKLLGSYTNFLAGIAMAARELKAHGRRDAQKVIFFMTDGEATAPFNKFCGDRLAMEFANELHSSDIRVNAFGIGRKANSNLAQRTLGPPRGIVGKSGTYTPVRSAADILNRIRDRTSSVVRAGAIVNRHDGIMYRGQNLQFNFDGTFSGNVEVQEGSNEIEVHIETVSGDSFVHRIPMTFAYPDGHLQRLREELIAEQTATEEIRRMMKQRKSLRLEIDEDHAPRSRQSGASKLEVLDLQ
jgi:hypothetical protein